MNARLLVALALVVCAVVARAEETEESSLANIETVEPTFLEAEASAVAATDAEAEGFPFQLPKKLQRTTVEPRYYGESAVKPKKYVHPEYRDPQPVKLTRKQRKLKPVTFTSHYFSPLPKKLKGKKLRAKRNKKNRSLVPFRHTVETPALHRQHKKGFTEAELFDGRLPNKYDDPRQNMKKTKAPAPQVSFVEFEAAVDAEGEVDTTEEMEADEEAEGPVPPPFQHDEGEQVATIIQAEEFFDANHQVPTWADEEASESVLVEEEAEAEVDAQETIQQMTQITIDQSKLPRLVPLAPTVSANDALEQAEDLEAFLESEHQATASFVEIAEEEEEEEEVEDESEDEAADEAEEEAEDEAEDVAEDEDEAEDGVEAEDEAEEEETEFAFVESAANTQEDSVDAEMDEMEQNELAASQIDMDATSDEAAMTAEDQNEAEEEVESEDVIEDMDADEDSSAEEADTTEEVIEDEEAVEDAENAVAVSLVEEASDAEEVDTLLSEVDAHLTGEGEGEAEADSELKGTPGHSIAAGQTWEDAQTERLNAMAAKLEAEKAATPKVPASVVSSKAELHSVDAAHQAPEYNSVEAEVETVEPELLVETAAAPASSQTVLLEKIAKLKAIRRA